MALYLIVSRNETSVYPTYSPEVDGGITPLVHLTDAEAYAMAKHSLLYYPLRVANNHNYKERNAWVTDLSTIMRDKASDIKAHTLSNRPYHSDTAQAYVDKYCKPEAKTDEQETA